MKLLKDYPDKPKILITGGAGFIGSAVIRRLLNTSNCIIYNLDKIGYASDLTSINNVLSTLGSKKDRRYELLKVNLNDFSKTQSAVKYADPDLIMHLAAESHVDRSIQGPEEFIKSNIIGTFNILEAAKDHFNQLSSKRQNKFRFHHISTDEVFGSLGKKGKFNENTKYDPRSPYSASKASSDNLVNAWHHTFGIPTLVTNCSNNYGPWQYPEKLIPKIIINALNNKPIPIYGDGENIRDWLYVEDHAEALIEVIARGEIGQKYCIGGNEERTNNFIVNKICELLDEKVPRSNSYKELIIFVKDRLGHDKRYAIDASKMETQLGWKPKFSFEEGLEQTVSWYIKNFKKE